MPPNPPSSPFHSILERVVRCWHSKRLFFAIFFAIFLRLPPNKFLQILERGRLRKPGHRKRAILAASFDKRPANNTLRFCKRLRRASANRMIGREAFRDSGGYRGWRVTAAAFAGVFPCAALSPDRDPKPEGLLRRAAFGIGEDRLEC